MADPKNENGKPGKADALNDVRKKIRERIAIAEQAKKIELQRHRLDLAGRGMNAYGDKDLANAAMAFKGYIKVLEDLKGVPNGGLSPAQFDKKEDIAEMMLISGVYWDLVKLYDRTRTPERYAEFKGYLGKYIQFAKGMPYQTMASETMRKYIQAKRPMHKQDFSDAYKQIAISKCFIATELVEYTLPNTIPALRDFRDEVLKQNRAGRRFVAWYYRKGPELAERVGRLSGPVKRAMGAILDGLGALTRWSRD
jgi:hypothetical protein